MAAITANGYKHAPGPRATPASVWSPAWPGIPSATDPLEERRPDEPGEGIKRGREAVAGPNRPGVEALAIY